MKVKDLVQGGAAERIFWRVDDGIQNDQIVVDRKRIEDGPVIHQEGRLEG